MIDVGPLFTLIGLSLLEALFTGLVLVGVVVFAYRLFKVKSVTVERESESRDQDRGD